MTSPYNRVSGLWSDYYDVETGEAEEEEDQRTELDKTIDKIGMGKYAKLSDSYCDSSSIGPYQWTLLSLCGFGKRQMSWASEPTFEFTSVTQVGWLITCVFYFRHSCAHDVPVLDSSHCNYITSRTTALRGPG